MYGCIQKRHESGKTSGNQDKTHKEQSVAVTRLDISASRNLLQRGDPKIEFGLNNNLHPNNWIHTGVSIYT
jgi:hypothetical protein